MTEYQGFTIARKQGVRKFNSYRQQDFLNALGGTLLSFLGTVIPGSPENDVTPDHPVGLAITDRNDLVALTAYLTDRRHLRDTMRLDILLGTTMCCLMTVFSISGLIAANRPDLLDDMLHYAIGGLVVALPTLAFLVFSRASKG